MFEKDISEELKDLENYIDECGMSGAHTRRWFDRVRAALSAKPDISEACQACGGSGGQIRTIGVAGCCGNGLPSGECCGNAIEVPEQIEEHCEYCGGSGKTDNKPDMSALIAEVCEGMKRKYEPLVDFDLVSIEAHNDAIETFAEKLTAALKDKGV